MFLKSFVRRSRPLSKAKQKLLEEVLPKFKIDLTTHWSLFAARGNPSFFSRSTKVDALAQRTMTKVVEKHYAKLNLEIGFGKGQFLASLSKSEGNSLNIGCEPYIEGIVSLLRKIKEDNIDNILIWPDDARMLISSLPDHSIDTIYILFPDPWPKRKQQRRRLISPAFIELASQKLKAKGSILFATDHHEYATWTFNHFERSKCFTCQDISERNIEILGINLTNYHQKNLEGKAIKVFRLSHLMC